MSDPRMAGAGPGKAFEMRCLGCDKVVLVSLNRMECIQALLAHLHRAHGDPGVIEEGRHFELFPAPVRCDLCGTVTEPPWWTYWTLPTLPAEDESWLVCDTCHGIVGGELTSVLATLVARVVECQRRDLTLDGFSRRMHLTTVRAAMQQFLTHLSPREPERGSDL